MGVFFFDLMGYMNIQTYYCIFDCDRSAKLLPEILWGCMHGAFMFWSHHRHIICQWVTLCNCINGAVMNFQAHYTLLVCIQLPCILNPQKSKSKTTNALHLIDGQSYFAHSSYLCHILGYCPG